MFMSELDKEKYSDVKQRERFELVRVANEITMDEAYVEAEEMVPPVAEHAEVQAAPQAPQLDAGVEEFLDADSYEEKMRIFTGMQHRLTDDMINIMAISLDTEVPEGELEERIASLKNFLLMQVKYECSRIR